MTILLGPLASAVLPAPPKHIHIRLRLHYTARSAGLIILFQRSTFGAFIHPRFYVERFYVLRLDAFTDMTRYSVYALPAAEPRCSQRSRCSRMWYERCSRCLHSVRPLDSWFPAAPRTYRSYLIISRVGVSTGVERNLGIPPPHSPPFPPRSVIWTKHPSPPHNTLVRSPDRPLCAELSLWTIFFCFPKSTLIAV